MCFDSSSRPVKSYGTRREVQKADTRALILGTARKLFQERGFDDATVRAIATEAGIGTGTVFAHFPDKQSLLVATVIDELQRVQEEAWSTIPKGAPLLERLLHLASVGFAYWCDRPSLSGAILREMYFTPGPAQEQLHELDQKAMKKHLVYFEEARCRGELREDVNPELLVKVTFSFYVSTVMMSLNHLIAQGGDQVGSSDSKPVLDGMIAQTREFLELLFEGIGGSSD